MTENKLPIQYRPTTINFYKGFEIMIGNTPILETTLGGLMGLVNAKIAEDKIKYLIERLNNSEINFEEISKCDSSSVLAVNVFLIAFLFFGSIAIVRTAFDCVVK